MDRTMSLQHLRLVHWRNYTARSWEFGPGINMVVGNNGLGKSNMLDAIHYLSFTKGLLHARDSLAIQHDKQEAVAEGRVHKKGTLHKLCCRIKHKARKEFSVDALPYTKLSEHIGQFPCVSFTPEDMGLVHGSSDVRKRMLDSLICQWNPEYLFQLQRYGVLLKERNSMLKGHVAPSQHLLAHYDAELAEVGHALFVVRGHVLEALEVELQACYKHLAVSGGVWEVPTLTYVSHHHKQDYTAYFARQWVRDKALQYTTVGVHRDDVELRFQGHLAKHVGSQGQQKLLALALRLAQYRLLVQHAQCLPFLLLDDLMGQLDVGRVQGLLDMLQSDPQVGQVFITDATAQKEQWAKRLGSQVHWIVLA